MTCKQCRQPFFLSALSLVIFLWFNPSCIALDAEGLKPANGDSELERSILRVKELLESYEYAKAEMLARDLLADTKKTHGAESLEAAKAMDLLVEALLKGGKAKEPESTDLAESA